MIMACRARGYDYKVPPYMSQYCLRANTLGVSQSSFKLYLDPTQMAALSRFRLSARSGALEEREGKAEEEETEV
jgi:hypothetical protein